jgi:DNA-directed RNA polymerase specialized sigma24 family protein
MRLLPPRTYGAGRRVRSWLHAIATNLARDRHRALVRRRADTEPDRAECLADDSDLSDRIIQSEQERVVRAAIRSLGHEQRATILLRFSARVSLRHIDVCQRTCKLHCRESRGTVSS